MTSVTLRDKVAAAAYYAEKDYDSGNSWTVSEENHVDPDGAFYAIADEVIPIITEDAAHMEPYYGLDLNAIIERMDKAEKSKGNISNPFNGPGTREDFIRDALNSQQDVRYLIKAFQQVKSELYALETSSHPRV